MSNNSDEDVVADQPAQTTGATQTGVDIKTRLDEDKLTFWHSAQAQLIQSKEVRDDLQKALKLKMKAQYELLEQEVGTALDIEKKSIFNRYLDAVSRLETQMTQKLDTLALESEQYAEEQREKFYLFFDQSREKIEKWRGNPERYERELERIKKNEQERLSDIDDKLAMVAKKRKGLFDQTVKKFEEETDIDFLRKKFKLF